MKHKNNIISMVLLLAAFAFNTCGGGANSGSEGTTDPSVVTIAAIPGVEVPVRGQIPAATPIDTAQYTGTISWAPDDNPFAPETSYTAIIELEAKAGFTITGVPKNFFTVAGATSVINSADSGIVVALFPKTGTILDIDVTFISAIQTGGASGTTDSTGLLLTFDADPATLTESNITVTGATKGALSGSGNTRTLGISNITVTDGSEVTVTITSPTGYAITGSPRTAVVYKAIIGVNFVDAAQIGGVSGTADTTGLALVFDADPTTLAASDITVTGATKGALSGSGIVRILTISNITVANGATVSVTVASPVGYLMSGSPKTEVVYRLLDIGVNYLGGKIAYFLQPGDPGYDASVPHGLIAAASDQTLAQWGCESTPIGGTSTALGTGMANTQAIVNGCGMAGIAARICNDLVLNGYSDWYLPSVDELNKLYVNKDAIGGFYSGTDLYRFYWSSSEANGISAYGLPFFDGTLYQINKAATQRVRAVRSF